MAERVGVSYSHYTKIERGYNKVSMRLLETIAREFDVRVEWLLNGNEPMRENAERGPDAVSGPAVQKLAHMLAEGSLEKKAKKVQDLLRCSREKALAIVLEAELSEE